MGDEKQQILGTPAVEGPKACVGTDVRYSPSSQGKKIVALQKRKKKKGSVSTSAAARATGEKSQKQGREWGSN